MRKTKRHSNTWLNKADFKKRVIKYAKQIDIPLKSISVRPMSRKWASCSTAGNLSFNAELLDMPKKLGDYVIVHELLHFHVPNHGKLWKSLMRAYLGDYKKLERRLKL
jgi:predicted metal-dependent hydrolase